MKPEEIKKQSPEELKKTLVTLLQEQFNLRMQKGYGELKRPHLVKIVRRNIARVKTALNNLANGV